MGPEGRDQRRERLQKRTRGLRVRWNHARRSKRGRDNEEEANVSIKEWKECLDMEKDLWKGPVGELDVVGRSVFAG